MNSGLFSLPLLPAEESEKASLRVATTASHGPHSGRPLAPDRFVAGPENAIVRTLAAAVVAEPLDYNPVVLCGACGVGKTSLAHTLVALRRDAFGLKHILVTSGADLARGLAHSIETDSVADLRSRHQRCDILLVDDVQRLAGKPAAQQFLLSAVDSLLRRGSLVVVTMRQLPGRTPGLNAALSSRLSAGLIAPLALPGALARQELVRQIAATIQFPLADDVVTQLAGNCEGADHHLATAPRLRHAVLQLAMSSSGQGCALEPAQIDRLIATKPADPQSVARRVLATVARHYGVSLGDLKGKSRQSTVSQARSMAMHLIRRLTLASYARIGKQLGGRDHSTVVHACQKLDNLIEHCDETRRLADELAMQVAGEGDAN